jgi:steroid 5-alpha reductase family enzyme
MIVLYAWIGVALVFVGLWKWQKDHSNAGIVDAGWSLSIGMLAVVFALAAEGDVARRWVLSLLVVAWSLRLGLHISRRVFFETQEDPRYAYLRQHWGAEGQRLWFAFFQAQGVAAVLLTLPVFVLMGNAKALGIWDSVGMVIMLAAIALEALADWQLKQWRENPANAGKTCRKGLWAVSRHPNYFFEWLFWLSQPVWGLALWQNGFSLTWLLLWFAPVTMLLLLVRGTGIPYTEKQALRKRGDDYRRYQKEVSAFIPWFPRSYTIHNKRKI